MTALASQVAIAEWTIVERGIGHAVYQDLVKDASGEVLSIEGQYTRIGNGIHYFEDNEWKVSENLIESHPDGAVARRSPAKAIFNPELNAEVVFDVLGSDGKRFKGGVRQIQLTDVATGQSVLVGTVKETVQGSLAPPNEIVYSDAFDGILCDVVLIWKHNAFSHEVVLRERPNLPADWDPAMVRLEVVTEFFVDEQPTLRTQAVPSPNGNPVLEDHVVIDFGRMEIVMGKAFPVDGELAVNLGALSSDANSAPVLKQWHRTSDDRNFLVESVAWPDAWPFLEKLKAVAQAADQAKEEAVMVARTWPKRSPAKPPRGPIQLAAAPYQARGYVVDYYTILSENPDITTFLSGQTYYIDQNYYSGDTVTFESGCFIKAHDDTYMLLYGVVNFPICGPHVTFTSWCDDKLGQTIIDSDGDPSIHRAAKAIWMYYPGYTSTIRNAKFRWAQTAIQYDENAGAWVNHYVENCTFKDSTVGLQNNLPDGTVYLKDSKYCRVTSPETGSGRYSGSIYESCVFQFEPAIAIDPNNPMRVAAFASQVHDSDTDGGILQAISSDGGRTWTRTVIATGSSPDGLPKGRNDQQTAFDDHGNLFLTYISLPSGSEKVQVYIAYSKDSGTTWQLDRTFGDGTTVGLDRPVIATGPHHSDSSKRTLWLLYIEGDHLRLHGAEVTGLGAVAWLTDDVPGSSEQTVATGLAVGPNGEVAMAYETKDNSSGANPTIFVNIDTDGFGNDDLVTNAATPFSVTMPYGHEIVAQPDRRISRVPVLAWDRNPSSSYYGRLYLAYTDLASITNPNDTDVFVLWYENGSWELIPRQVNDSSTSSQFFPGLAVDHTSGNVALSWYDCRDDPGHKLTHFYAAVSKDGFTSTVSPVNVQLTCFPSDGTVNCAGSFCCWGSGMNYGDYTGLAFHGGYVLPAWISYGTEWDRCGEMQTARILWTY